MLTTLFKLLIGHALADFSLQTPTMSKLKNRYNKPDFIPDGQKYVPTWGFWLSAHALIHGGATLWATNSPILGFIQTLAHMSIDFLKCENITTPYIDQALHLIVLIVLALLSWLG